MNPSATLPRALPAYVYVYAKLCAKLCAGGGAGGERAEREWRTSAMRYDEPRPVSASLTTKH